MKTSKLAVALSSAALLTGVIAGCSAQSADSLAADPRAHTDAAKLGIELPGPGAVIDAAKTIYDKVEHCRSNQAAGLPCMQSTDETVNQIYVMLRDFTAKYDKDQERARASFDEVIKNQKDAAVQAEWREVAGDLETAHVAIQLLNSYAECAQVVASDKTGDCTKIDELGNTVPGGQPATLDTLTKIQNDIIAQDNGSRDNVGGYKISPTYFAQRIGGSNAKNPYAAQGLMHAVLAYEEALEVSRQGLTPGTKLSYYPSSYVNEVGQEISAIAAQETGYFAARIAAAKMNGRTDFAESLERLATVGRADTSPVLSIQAQQNLFTFPGWSLGKQLAANQAYFVGKKTGAVLLTNLGDSSSAPKPENAGLPTNKQLSAFGEDFGADYVKTQKLYSKELPAIPEQLAGNAGKKDMNAVARIWSAPQKTWDATAHFRVGNVVDHDTIFPMGCSLNRSYPTAAGCAAITSTEAIVYGDTIRMKGPKGNFVEVTVPAGAVMERPLPVTIYPQATDVEKGWGYQGHSGQTQLALPKSMTTIANKLGGSEVTALSAQPGPRFAEPTWEAYHTMHPRYDMPKGPNGATYYDDKTDSFGPGVLLAIKGVSAGNLQFDEVEPAGALR